MGLTGIFIRRWNLNETGYTSIRLHAMKNRNIYWRRNKIQETLYIGHWCLSIFQSRHLGASHSSPNRHQLPWCILLNLIDGLKSLPFQRRFWFWKESEVSGYQIWAIGGLFTKNLCIRYDARRGKLLWWSCQSPVAYSCRLLNHPNSFCGRMPKLNEKFDVGSLLYSLSHSECDGHTAHMLTQWCLLSPLTSTMKLSLSHTCVPVHCPWLPVYIDITQTIFIIVTVVGLFLDRTPMCPQRESGHLQVNRGTRRN